MHRHPVLKTRNIDAIAEAGTLWNRFSVTSPVCMPKLARLMTLNSWGMISMINEASGNVHSHNVAASALTLQRR